MISVTLQMHAGTVQSSPKQGPTEGFVLEIFDLKFHFSPRLRCGGPKCRQLIAQAAPVYLTGTQSSGFRCPECISKMGRYGARPWAGSKF